ncbi:MAG: glycosyltransferase family 4 protein [Melioribacteraceae bacterium]|nr:glycosyltransferase family 4 protein [Melioribacteraceae bacterium]
MNPPRKICFAFLGNPLNDSRITNLSDSLINEGCEIFSIGFDWSNNSKLMETENQKIFRLIKGKFSLLFYLRFAFKLIKEVTKLNCDVYFAEDFYTLPFLYIIARFKNAKVIYNSREIYAFLGGHQNRPILSKIVGIIERYFIKKVDLVLTTGEMDSEFLEKFYGIHNTLVIRNIPLAQPINYKFDFRKELGIPEDKTILLYQGVIIGGRGFKPTLEAMKLMPDVYLVVLGDGERQKEYEEYARDLGILGRVFFMGTIAQSELINYTAGGDLGICLIENISVSYYHALPNKLFEYINAGLPVISSNLPQMKKIVEQYNVGIVIDDLSAESIASSIKKLISEKGLMNKYSSNCLETSKELNWQKEYERIRDRLFEFVL